jgi:hypothetical protein
VDEVRVRAHVDAEGGQVQSAAAFALAVAFVGRQDVGAYERGRGAVEAFGVAGWGWGKQRGADAEAVATSGWWGASVQHPEEESDGKVQHVDAPLQR